jgi:putative solute:sodium symporter small subunit
MIDWRERKAYWLHTKVQMAATLVPLLLSVLVLPLYADALNSKRILGAPLGYFLVGHGVFIIAGVLMAAWINRQDAIDHWHGGNEDV